VSHHLVLVDLQRIFADAGSPWGSTGFDAVRGPVRRLLEVLPEVTWTRFVAPEQPTGAWVAYYDLWPFALTPPDHEQYDVVDGLGWTPSAATLTATTFGKWGPDLAARVGDATLVLAGVSTDCCVLSTALAAADAGVPVLVVTDACAGIDEHTHAQALAAMELYAPLVTLTTSAELAAALTA
jgi:nicotinamidase-related amidase